MSFQRNYLDYTTFSFWQETWEIPDKEQELFTELLWEIKIETSMDSSYSLHIMSKRKDVSYKE